MELRDIDQDDSILDELDISKYLVFKKPDEEGPDIRGGHPDALLIHATKANKHGKNLFKFRNLNSIINKYYERIMNKNCTSYSFMLHR